MRRGFQHAQNYWRKPLAAGDIIIVTQPARGWLSYHSKRHFWIPKETKGLLIEWTNKEGGRGYGKWLVEFEQGTCWVRLYPIAQCVRLRTGYKKEECDTCHLRFRCFTQR